MTLRLLVVRSIRLLTLLVLVVLMLGTAACSTSESGYTSATSTPASATSEPKVRYVKVRVDPDLPRRDLDMNVRHPRTFTPEQAAVVKAWANFLHVFAVMLDPPDPDFPELTKYTDEIGERATRDSARGFEQRGVSVSYPSPSILRQTVTRVDVDGSTATAHVCIRTDATSTKSDGTHIMSGVFTLGYSLRFVKEDRRWLVSGTTGDLRQWGGDNEAACL